MAFSKNYDKYSLRKYFQTILDNGKKVYNKTHSENIWNIYEYWLNNCPEAKLLKDLPKESTSNTRINKEDIKKEISNGMA